MDVDVTLFLPPAEVSGCAQLLEFIGCKLANDGAERSLSEHGYCQVEFRGGRIDAFDPVLRRGPQTAASC